MGIWLVDSNVGWIEVANIGLFLKVVITWKDMDSEM